MVAMPAIIRVDTLTFIGCSLKRSVTQPTRKRPIVFVMPMMEMRKAAELSSTSASLIVLQRGGGGGGRGLG